MITSAKIIGKGKDWLQIAWEDNKDYFGHLGIRYSQEGKYEIDSEYLGIETVMEILKKINNEDNKRDIQNREPGDTC